jgi:hypothetical protein
MIRAWTRRAPLERRAPLDRDIQFLPPKVRARHIAGLAQALVPKEERQAQVMLAGAQALSADAERRRGCDSLLPRDHVGERVDEMTEELMASSAGSPGAPNEIA